MIETLLHACGLCRDAHCHPDLMDLVAVGFLTTFSVAWYAIRDAFRRKEGG